MRRRRAQRPPAPLAGIDTLFYALGGIFVPCSSFVLAAVEEDTPVPESKQQGWHGFVGLLFHRDANWAFGLLLAASALALGAMLTDSGKYARSVSVRVLILGGVVISATFVVLGSLSHGAVILLPLNLAVLALSAILWRIRRAYRLVPHVTLVALCLGALIAIVLPDALIVILAVPLAGPACALAAYGAMWLRLGAIARADPAGTAQEDPPLGRPFLLWLAGYGAAFAHALVQARRLFEQLPEHPTGCYVATAAARGHPRLVRSWPVGGTRVNAQLVWLKAGELALARLAPRLHRIARGVYDRVGPPLAACLRDPLAADLAYLSLKPAELAVRATFRVVLRARGRRRGGRITKGRQALHWPPCRLGSRSSSSSRPRTRRR